MSEKFTSNNIDNDEFNFKTEDLDYEKLISRLNDISQTIVLLEKTIFR